MSDREARPTIFLVGFMGTGKTTIGRLLAKRLMREFTDLDEAVEAAAGLSIARIFEEGGEDRFRALEASVLRGLAARAGGEEASAGRVVACGGGTLSRAENRTLMAREGVTVWLRQPFERIWGRRSALSGSRPLFGGEPELRSLYEARRPLYAGADLALDVEEDGIDRAVDELVRLLRQRALID